jgi:hypothetical protein
MYIARISFTARLKHKLHISYHQIIRRRNRRTISGDSGIRLVRPELLPAGRGHYYRHRCYHQYRAQKERKSFISHIISPLVVNFL